MKAGQKRVHRDAGEYYIDINIEGRGPRVLLRRHQYMCVRAGRGLRL
jgi:hypothetical protein